MSSVSVKCCVCSDEFPILDDLEAHISADHYNCLPFECEKCKFAKFPTEFSIKRHYEEDHGLSEYFIRYRVSREIYEKRQKIRECLERCFRHMVAEVGSTQHQINVTTKNLLAAEYATSSHYQGRQLHESELLASPKMRSAGNSIHSSAELFHQQHMPNAADMRHHQADIMHTDGISGFDQISASTNLIGSLLEQIKPEVELVDGGALAHHFDQQLYSADTTATASATAAAAAHNQHEQDQQQQLAFASQKVQQQQQQDLLSMSGSPAPSPPVGLVVTAATGGGGGSKQLQQNHNGMTNSTPTNGAVQQTTIRMSGGGPKHPGELQCRECSRMVVNRSTSLLYHVNTKHLKQPLYKCRQCGEEFLWNRPAALRHAHRHGGDETLIENFTDQLFPILNRYKREYFNLGRQQHQLGQQQRDGSPQSSTTSGSQHHQQQNLEMGGCGPGEELIVGPEGEEPMSEVKEEMAGEGEEEIESERVPMAGRRGQMLAAEEKMQMHEGVGHKRKRGAHLLDEGARGEGAGAAMGQQLEMEDKEYKQSPNSILARLVDMTSSSSSSAAVGSPSHKQTAAMEGTPKEHHHQQHHHGQLGSSSGQQTIRQKSVQCGGCGDPVINQEWIMLNHVNTKHLHLPLYKCISCNKPFENYLRSYAVRHAKFYHAGDESLLLDQRDEFWAQLRDACAQFFGHKGEDE